MEKELKWLVDRVAHLEAQLADLSQHITVQGSGYLEIRNVKIVADGHNLDTILALGSNNASGWQRPLAVDGAVKCLICEELTEKELICGQCRNAILDARAVGAEGHLATLSEAVSRGLLTKWIEEQLEGMEE